MTDPADLADLSAHAAASGLADRSFSATELARAHLQRLEARNAALNCIWQVDAEGALAQAAATDARIAAGTRMSPLDGLPYTVKDNIAVAGLRWTAGLATRRDTVAGHDAFVVQRLRKHGAVLLGKASLHEGALGADNDNPHYGACHHPHRHGYTPGGSSGGSAAAVAAGIGVFSLGSDTMGSCRIPAAYCGVAGFKPSAGRVSQRGLLPTQRRLDCAGLLGRNAADLHLPYHVIAAADPLDAQSRSVPLRHVEQPLPRLGFLPAETLPGLQQGVAAVYERSLARLRQHYPLQPLPLQDYDYGALRRAGLLLCEAAMAHLHATDLAERPQLYSPTLRAMLQYPARCSAVELAAADLRLDQAILALRRVFDQVDILLTPTTPQVAFAFGTPAPASQADYTAIANFAGTPALSLPAGRDGDGLPVGLQLLGPVGSDLQLLLLGERIEALLA